MSTNGNLLLLPEIGPDGLPRESPVIAYTEKIIEKEQLQLKKYIEENYSKIRDVEREFANLSLELKLTAGSKNAALEHLRKKIEAQNEKISEAKIKEEQAKKAWEATVEVVKDEEAVKQKLCADLNNLVQESNNSQFKRLEELKRRLEALNPGRASMSTMPNSASVNGVMAATAPSPNPGNTEKIPIGGAHNRPVAVSDGERRGKKKSLYNGGGRETSGWTGAGFDLDGID